MGRQFGVGILGLGHWYSAYHLARALPEYPKAKLVAVACREPDKLDEFASTFGIDGYADYGQLVERDDVDLVHICPPVVDIPECAIRAARAGKHMVLGKPMAMRVEQADEIVEAVRAAGVKCVPFQGMYRMRSLGLKRQLDDGVIGDVVVMHACGRWSIAEDWFRSGKPGWFADPRQVPGGAFIDEGIYAVNLLLWLAGSKVVQVEARMANLVHKDIEVEDWGMATFTFANGIVATLEASWTVNSPRKSGPSPKQNAVNRLEVVGTRGEIIQDSLAMPGQAVLAAGADNWVFERQEGERYTPPPTGAFGHLVDCVEADREPSVTVEDAREAFVVALAAYESAREGKPVRLSW